MAKGRTTNYRGSGTRGPEPTKQGGSIAERGKIDKRAKKDRAEARTRTCSDVLNGLNEDELEKANVDKSGNKSETADFSEMFGLEKWPSEVNRWVEKHQGRNRKRAVMDLLSRQAD